MSSGRTAPFMFALVMLVVTAPALAGGWTTDIHIEEIKQQASNDVCADLVLVETTLATNPAAVPAHVPEWCCPCNSVHAPFAPYPRVASLVPMLGSVRVSSLIVVPRAKHPEQRKDPRAPDELGKEYF